MADADSRVGRGGVIDEPRVAVEVGGDAHRHGVAISGIDAGRAGAKAIIAAGRIEEKWLVTDVSLAAKGIVETFDTCVVDGLRTAGAQDLRGQPTPLEVLIAPEDAVRERHLDPRVVGDTRSPKRRVVAERAVHEIQCGEVAEYGAAERSGAVCGHEAIDEGRATVKVIDRTAVYDLRAISGERTRNEGGA